MNQKIIKKLVEHREKYLRAREETKKLEDEKISNSLYHKLHFDSIDRSYKSYSEIKEKRLDLFKSGTAEEQKAKFRAGDKNISETSIIKEEANLQGIIREELQAEAELKKDIARGSNFSLEINKKNNDSKIIEKINQDDIQKSTFFGLDELFNNFESLSGLSKLLCTIILSSSIIL